MENGVLLYPTFSTTAYQHGESLLNVGGVGYPMIWNILGFPATTIPMGLSKNGLPIGISVRILHLTFALSLTSNTNPSQNTQL